LKYVCSQCNNVFQADDITVHYINGDNGFKIITICPQCLEGYMKKIRAATEQKEDERERKKMKMKW
jgi:hypothetical protein